MIKQAPKINNYFKNEKYNILFVKSVLVVGDVLSLNPTFQKY
jgi:hypothetical protein